MASFEALGRLYEVALRSLKGLDEEQRVESVAHRPQTARAAARARATVGPAAVARLVGASAVLKSRVDNPLDLALVQATGPGARRPGRAGALVRPDFTLVTQTVIGEGLRQADLAAALNFGATIVDEGLDGKVLLKVDTVERVFGLVDLLLKREVGAVSPNFLRRVVRLQASPPTGAWAHEEDRRTRGLGDHEGQQGDQSGRARRGRRHAAYVAGGCGGRGAGLHRRQRPRAAGRQRLARHLVRRRGSLSERQVPRRCASVFVDRRAHRDGRRRQRLGLRRLSPPPMRSTGPGVRAPTCSRTRGAAARRATRSAAPSRAHAPRGAMARAPWS